MSSFDERAMRWDLLEGAPPEGQRLLVRLAYPSRRQDVLIGIDAARRRSILVEVPQGEPSSITERSSRGITVQTVEMNDVDGSSQKTFIEVACVEAAGHAALDIVTLELVDALAAGASIGRVRLVQGVLAKWRRFWGGVAQNLLSREEQLGLFGELWFLSRWLIPSVGAAKSVAMWRGPAGARNDFEGFGIAIEVKTSSRLDGSHTVNGLEQLLEPEGGMLLLFSLNIRDEASGTESLSKIVHKLKAYLASHVEELGRLETMLCASGYDERHEPEYEKLRLRVRAEALYRVQDGFPRLVPASIKNAVPPGVNAVRYELRLDAAGQWLLSDSPKAAAKFLHDISS